MTTTTHRSTFSWIILNAFGYGACNLAGNLILLGMCTLACSANDPNRYLTASVFGASFGLFVALLQSIRLYDKISTPLFIGGAAFGNTLGFLVLSLISAALGDRSPLYLLATIAGGGAAGVVSGGIQWLALQEARPAFKPWIWVNGMAGVISYPVFWVWRLGVNIGDCSFSFMMSALCLSMIVGPLAGIVYGIITRSWVLQLDTKQATPVNITAAN